MQDSFRQMLVVYTTCVNWGNLRPWQKIYCLPTSRSRPSSRPHISAGTWKPGDPVPSEAALAAQFGISRMTVNRALRELTAEGLVTRVQGSGTRVAELHRISSAPDDPRHP